MAQYRFADGENTVLEIARSQITARSLALRVGILSDCGW
jgi:hypothetical protein